MSCSHLGMNLLAKRLKGCGRGAGGGEERFAWGGEMDDADVVDDDDWSLLVEDDGMLPVVVAGPIIVGLSVCARAMAGSGLRPWGGKHNRHQNE